MMNNQVQRWWSYGGDGAETPQANTYWNSRYDQSSLERNEVTAKWRRRWRHMRSHVRIVNGVEESQQPTAGRVDERHEGAERRLWGPEAHGSAVGRYASG
ncbi:unnamed protein product [Phytophthora fragariaefolia]|uniref:Unnamed protein product n=1 Tax=Phytophthora fragariaefolia TaxID=1490495 RepID=A0A9W6XE89_9STRA|nr:unnamed protein product [Phytophthora fragariaefolia]